MKDSMKDYKGRKLSGPILVNIAVLLFGLAGLFAKWIQLPAIGITFGRVLVSSFTLGTYMLIKEKRIPVPERRDLFLLIGAGMVLALHWWAFLESIQISTVAIGTITFSSFPLFVTFLEPLLFRKRLTRKNVFFAVMIIFGVFITIPEFSFENRLFTGIVIGMISSLAYAVLTLMNKNFVGKYSGTMTAFYEQATAAVVLIPFIAGLNLRPSVPDISLLVFMGAATTALAHTLFISSLKDIPAQLAGICSSMETVYGILFASLLLGEIPSLREVLGAVIIVGVVIAAQL